MGTTHDGRSWCSGYVEGERVTPLWIRTAAIAATVGSGLVAGTFFAFSSFVMGALGRLPAVQGIAAMQSINVVVLNPLFLGVFLGTAALSLGLAIAIPFHLSTSGIGFLLAGSMLYLLGTFLVTILGNVPMNDALAAVTPGTGAETWARYQSGWTIWNHVRTLAATGATLAFVLGLIRLAGAR